MVPTIVVRIERRLPLLLTWLLIVAFLVVLGSTYVGHAASPYDMCTRPDGRPIACAAQREIDAKEQGTRAAEAHDSAR